MSAESPAWLEKARELTPHWGTTHPLTLDEITSVALYDINGRPIQEDLTIAPNIAGVPFDIRPSVNPDFRHGEPTNMSAFESTARDFEQALSIVSYLRGQMLPYGKRMNATELVDIVFGISQLPFWFVLKSNDPLENGRVPSIVASVNKISRGVGSPPSYSLAEKRFQESFGQRYKPDTAFENPQGFIEKIIDTEATVGNELVCPAPQAMIERTIKAIYEPVQGSDEVRERLNLDDTDIKGLKKMGMVQRVMAVEALFFAKAPFHTDESPGFKLRSVALDSLDKLNRAQRWLNQALGRSEASPMTLDDLASLWHIELPLNK